MSNPLEEINQEEITTGLNGEETLLLMKLILLGTSLNIYDLAERDTALSIVEKLGPGIERQAARELRIMRDGLN